MLTALLYTILIMSIRSKARNIFPISLMTISTISILFIIEVRSEMLPMIPSRKLFFVVLSILATIFCLPSLRQRIYRSSQMSLQALYFLWYQRDLITCCSYFLYHSRCQAPSYRLYHSKTSKRLFY